MKAVTNLEEVKEALLELEDGYHVFPNQSSWQESIHAVKSSDTVSHNEPVVRECINRVPIGITNIQGRVSKCKNKFQVLIYESSFKKHIKKM